MLRVDTWFCQGCNAFPLLEVPSEAELHCAQALWMSGTGDVFESRGSWDAALSVLELVGFKARIKKKHS